MAINMADHVDNLERGWHSAILISMKLWMTEWLAPLGSAA
jgi:hypothetical protein